MYTISAFIAPLDENPMLEAGSAADTNSMSNNQGNLTGGTSSSSDTDTAGD